MKWRSPLLLQIEFTLVSFDDARKKSQLSLVGPKIPEILQQPEIESPEWVEFFDCLFDSSPCKELGLFYSIVETSKLVVIPQRKACGCLPVTLVSTYCCLRSLANRSHVLQESAVEFLYKALPPHGQQWRGCLSAC